MVDVTAIQLAQLDHFSYILLFSFCHFYHLLSSLILSYLLLSSFIFFYLLLSSFIFFYLILSSFPQMAWLGTSSKSLVFTKKYQQIIEHSLLSGNHDGEHHQIDGSNMEEDPEVLSANSWHGQSSIFVRDFPLRVFARLPSTPDNWQSQWIATDIWLGARSNRMDQRQSSIDQVQDARD